MTESAQGAVYPVPPGWRLFRVDDIKATEPHSCVAGPFGSNIASRFFVDQGVPIIRGSNLRDDLTRFVSDSFAFVTETRAREEYQPQHAKAGDLVFTCWGTVGQVGIIPDDGPYPLYVISNKQLKLRVNRDIADPLFCFYYFASPRHVDFLRNRGIGGAVPGINLGILKSLTIALPPLPVQRRVTDILGAYDDLIENNLRRMVLLEEAARLLYREWFVLLRFPGHEHTRIINGVPAGWERKSLGEVATLKYGKALREEERQDGAIRVYGSSGVVGTHDQKLVSGPGIVVGRKGNVGSVYWVDGAFWPIDTVYYVDAVESSLFLLHNLMDQPFQSSDAAVPGLNRSYASGLPVLLPKKALRDEFEACARVFREQIRVLAQMNVKLRAGRDLLLPRLMSGEIVV